MRAMVLHGTGPVEGRPLKLEEVPIPEPREREVLVEVDACGVCRTDLHVVEGDLPPLRSAVIPGHEIVGKVVQLGPNVRALSVGDRVGVPWLHWTCGRCEYCRTGRENLCEEKTFTGYGENGGYAPFVVGKEDYVLPLPPEGDSAGWAPFLCAGLIGYRALKTAMPRFGGRIGFFGFGGSAHLTLQLASRLGYETVAYSRTSAHLALAKSLGATETVLTTEPRSSPSPPLDSAIVFAPAGSVVIDALKEVRKGGTVAIAGIHMSPIPSIDYDRLLFGERRIASVEANTRADAREFLDLSAHLPLKSTVEPRPLAKANEALADLKSGRIDGVLVLDVRSSPT